MTKQTGVDLNLFKNEGNTLENNLFNMKKSHKRMSKLQDRGQLCSPLDKEKKE